MIKLSICTAFFLIHSFISFSLLGVNNSNSEKFERPTTILEEIFLLENSIAQNKGIPTLKEYLIKNGGLPGEKVYLHTDRKNYMQCDTIWFKAYSWFGFEQIADTVSKVLYVDLLNPEGKVELKKKLLIQNGTSVGEFCLDKNIPPGRYNIKAYTRWMQNENTGEPFYQTVTISSVNQNVQVDCSPLIIKQADGDSLKVAFRFYEIDNAGELRNDFNHKLSYSVRIGDRRLETGEALASSTKEKVFKCRLPGIGEKDSLAVLRLSIKDERLTFEKEFRISLKEELDLQFFPEGGRLVDGLESKVAFKAIGADGLNREVKGIIKSGDGEEVANFTSLHKGMGAFIFTPEKNKQYTAVVEYNHRQYKFPLPGAEEEGCVLLLKYKDKENVPTVNVKYSSSKANAEKYVVGNSYGNIRFVSKIKTTEDSCRVNIPVELFPEGVSRITLLNSEFKPECERLIYIDRDQRFKIEVKPDSSSYGIRSKISLSVKTTSPNGEAVPSNLSLAAVDKEQIIKDGGAGGISAYKLLESELKGYIEDVGGYFKDDSLINREALDLLLLTQGYRRFVNGNAKSSVIKFYPERGFEVTGKLALPGNSKRDKNFNYSELGVSLLCPSENAWFDQTHPDSLGKFTFYIPPIYGKPLSILKAFTPTGKLSREKIPKEKSFRGDILLDEVPASPLFTPPAVSPINIAAPATEYVRQLQSVMKTEVSKVANGIAWHLNLPEFTVTGKDKDWYTHFEEEANKIVDMDSLDPTGNKYGNIYDLLIREFGARKYRAPNFETVSLPCVCRAFDYWLPIYVLNGQKYCNEGEGGQMVVGLLNQLVSIRVNEIKKLMVIPPGNLTYHYADHNIILEPPFIKQSLVDIETYSKHTFYRGDPDGIKTFVLEGLDSPRVFYSPRYEGPSRQNPIYDGRATLYWNPSVRTNDKGEAKIEFYTGDRKTEMEVIVNGIEIGNGFPGQGRTEINSNFKK